MLDSRLLPLLARILTPGAKRLSTAGIPADAITVGGFLIGLCAVPLIASGAYAAALACILANRLCDGLDGAVARLQGPTDRGAFLDIALDFFFYASVPLAFALADPANAAAAAVLLLAFVGTGSSFLAASVVAAQRGLTSTAFPEKGIFYLGGLTEGTETIAVFVLFCLWPAAFAPLAYVFAALCFVTTLLRWWWGWRTFG